MKLEAELPAAIISSEPVKKHFPALVSAGSMIGGVAVQNRATIGGNLVNASAAADIPPLLFVLGATLVLQSKDGTREVPVTEFYSGYRKTVLRPNELLKSIKIPLPLPETRQFFYKRGSRLALTISRLSVAGFARGRWRGHNRYSHSRRQHVTHSHVSYRGSKLPRGPKADR